MTIYKRLFLYLTVLVVLTGVVIPPAGEAISIKEEEELSRKMLPIIFKHYKVLQTPIIVNYINDLGQKILSQFPPQPFKYRFYVVKDDSLNAFATPAGHIFIHSGLIQASDSEEELAGVIAHEIAHVFLRHISHKIDRSKKSSKATLAALAAGLLTGVGAIAAVAVAANQASELAYSRQDETEADQAGFEYLNRAGYSAKGLLAMMNKMHGKQLFDSSVIPTYLLTHPGHGERMANMDVWIAKHEQVQPNYDPYPFNRARTWLVASHGDRQGALTQFQAEVAQQRKNPLAHYGYGLSLARNGQFDHAVDQMRLALEMNAFEPYFITALGRIYFFAGRFQEALNILVSFESIAPNHPRRLYFLGRTQMELGHYQEAVDALEKTVQLYPNYTSAYQFLGLSYGKMEKASHAHYYLGIYYKRISNLKNADFHLQKALTLMNDPAKRREIEKLLSEMQGKKGKKRKG